MRSAVIRLLNLKKFQKLLPKAFSQHHMLGSLKDWGNETWMALELWLQFLIRQLIVTVLHLVRKTFCMLIAPRQLSFFILHSFRETFQLLIVFHTCQLLQLSMAVFAQLLLLVLNTALHQLLFPVEWHLVHSWLCIGLQRVSILTMRQFCEHWMIWRWRLKVVLKLMLFQYRMI